MTDTELEPITEIMLVSKAMGHEGRMGILQALGSGLCHTSEILEAIDGPPLSSMRHHISLLVKAGLVTTSRDGREQRWDLEKDKLWRYVELITKWFRTL